VDINFKKWRKQNRCRTAETVCQQEPA